MPDNLPKKYYAYRPILRFFARYALLLSGILLAIAVLSQLSAGRFPAYLDLAFAVCIPAIAFVAIAVLVFLSDYLNPLTVNAQGLKGNNCYGRPSTITWDQIVATQPVKKFDSFCLYVELNTFNPPFVIPLWLHEFDDFCITVERCAGHDNALVIALRNATHFKS